jgi:hypothetical protein
VIPFGLLNSGGKCSNGWLKSVSNNPVHNRKGNPVATVLSGSLVKSGYYC